MRKGSTSREHLSVDLSASGFVLAGVALLILGWVLPQDQFGNEWFSFRYPGELWVRYFFWLALRLVGTVVLAIYALSALWRRSRHFGAGVLLGLGLPLTVYLAVGVLGVIIDPILEARIGPFLRFLGAVSLTVGGVLVTRGAADQPEPSHAARRPGLLRAGVLLMTGAAVFAWVARARSEAGGSTFFALPFLAAAVLLAGAGILLSQDNRIQLASGLLIGAGADALLGSTVEFVGAILDPDPFAWAASVCALAGGSVAIVLGSLSRPGRRETAIPAPGQPGT
jgi:hypothetical protein